MSKFKKHHNYIEKIEKDDITKSNIPIKEIIFNNKIVIGILLVSFFLNIVLFYSLSLGENELGDIPEKKSSFYEKYKYISKRVSLEEPNDIIINFVSLRKTIREYVNAQNGTVGVYFEYLPSGVSVGANDREAVKLASLSKVPLVMAIFKKIEKREISLNTKITLRKEDLDNGFGKLWEKGEGAIFTVEELINFCLRDSDNTAYQSLFRMLTNDEVVDVYNNLEIQVTLKDDQPIVSPKSFSSIFRSLYLSSYLLPENSNYILDILTKTSFKDKMPSGVPATVSVAHKIGVFLVDESLEKVYSDCGIVYVPARPYILCIFIQDNEVEAVKHIGHISKIIYEYVSTVKGGNN